MNWKQGGCVVVAGLTLAVVTAFAAQVMNVQVKEGQVRSTPSFVGKIVGKAGYGQSVNVLEQRGDWSQVSFAGVGGWMHASALTAADLDLQSGSGAPSSVSGQEMALAGKGFNSQVEKEYRQAHGGDFAGVDRMERNTVPTETLMAFLKDGGVKPQGGAQ
jgi:uncharacterized protein YgiM (DUF1202 family)